MEICKSPTLRLKSLNKHSITHIMYIEMENVIGNKNACKKYFLFFRTMSKQLRSVQLYAKAWIYMPVGVIRTTLKHTQKQKSPKGTSKATHKVLCLTYTHTNAHVSTHARTHTRTHAHFSHPETHTHTLIYTDSRTSRQTH